MTNTISIDFVSVPGVYEVTDIEELRDILQTKGLSIWSNNINGVSFRLHIKQVQAMARDAELVGDMPVQFEYDARHKTLTFYRW